jgi:DNA-binding NarL/FixJ family response regulator
MRLVLIVDADAPGLSIDLNQLVKRDRLDLQFKPCSNPEEMFREIRQRTPDLIVLHHNWSGLGISDLLNRLASETNAATRVVVFTGQTVKVSELIECVRCGVADYWTKNMFDVNVALRQISHYCSSSSWTIGSLRMSSGSLRQLLDRVESLTQQLNMAEQDKSAFAKEVEALKSQERRRLLDVIYGVMKVVVIVMALVGGFITVDRFTHLDTWANLAFMAILAVCFLLSEGRITSAWVKWTGGAAGVTALQPVGRARGKGAGS